MRRSVFRVRKNILVLVAGFVWLLAGGMVCSIGYPIMRHMLRFWPIMFTIIVFMIFHFLIFQRYVRKHVKRIRFSFPTHGYLWQFFDRKSYIIMFSMMTFGILLRKSGWASEEFIGPFYSGLGTALALAGISFLIAYRRREVLRVDEASGTVDSLRKVSSRTE